MTHDGHPARALWRSHHRVAPYPRGVLGGPEPVVFTSFFPGGYGLWNPSQSKTMPPFPFGGVMVVGHDYHSEEGYRASVLRGRESESQPTWRNLIELLTEASILPDDCFFTNAYMGLRRGSATTGVFPGAGNER